MSRWCLGLFASAVSRWCLHRLGMCSVAPKLFYVVPDGVCIAGHVLCGSKDCFMWSPKVT